MKKILSLFLKIRGSVSKVRCLVGWGGPFREGGGCMPSYFCDLGYTLKIFIK